MPHPEETILRRNRMAVLARSGTARLRVTLSAAHSEADIDRLLEALQHTLADLPEKDI